MQRFRTFAREIHRRSLWQVLTIYLVGSWIGYQVVLALTAGLGLPDWVPGFAVALFVIGLPIVLATAFIQEGAPGRADRAGPTAPTMEGLEPTVPSRAGDPDPVSAPAAAARPIAHAAARRLFTWNGAVTAGVLAFALLGLAATGFMGMRTLGIGPAGTLMARGVVEARDPIVLADFGNSTGDERLGEVVTDALRIDLLSSPVIELVSDGSVRETLGRMRRSAADPLDTELALEVAAREGYKAVITGEVSAVGAGYVLTARILSTDGGAVLAGLRETAATQADLLPAIDRLSGAMRARIGESLRSTRASEPLDRVTTTSLEALRAYSRAIRLGDREGELLRAIALLEEAVALDPGFAMAHRKIGVTLSNLGVERHRMVEAITRAYDHRDRLTERERGHAVAFYHAAVVGDRRAAIAAYENLLERHPDDAVARNNLALAFNEQGEFRSAEAAITPIREAGTFGPSHFLNLARALWGQGRYEEASAVVAEFADRYDQSPAPLVARVFVASAERDWEAAGMAVEAMRAGFPTNMTAVARSMIDGAALVAVQGRVRAAGETTDSLAELAASLGLPSAAALSLAAAAMLEGELTGDADRVAARVDRLLGRYPLDSLQPLDRPYLPLVQAWLAVGRTDRAEALFREYEATVPEELRGADRPLARLVRGALAVQGGDIDGGLADLEAAARDMNCRVCGLVELGRAHERAGDADAALRIYTRYVETPEVERLSLDQAYLGFVLRRLADLHDERGNAASAADYYNQFVTLWAGADADLQPRVEAARRRLAQLTREG
jgi:eukaryotic-like serine/threonine-protein kinase